MLTLILKNAETGDEVYSFKLPAIFTHQQYSEMKEYNLYYDHEMSQLQRF